MFQVKFVVLISNNFLTYGKFARCCVYSPFFRVKEVWLQLYMTWDLNRTDSEQKYAEFAASAASILVANFVKIRLAD
jgi:hypothetical protein